MRRRPFSVLFPLRHATISDKLVFFSVKELVMERRFFAGAALLSCLLLSMSGTPAPAAAAQAVLTAPSAAPTLQARPNFGKMPVAFVPNEGQMDRRIAYYVHGKDRTIYFGSEGLTFLLTNAAKEGQGSRWVVKLDFVGADPKAKPVGLDKTGTAISYFQGPPGNWKYGLPSYSRILYENLWPGIDLAYSGSADRMKYEFIVRPGADPDRIRLAYRGVSSVRVNGQGRLVVATPAGGFEDGEPLAYQETAGTRVGVPMAYALEAPAPNAPAALSERTDEGNAVVYGFAVGAYDRARTLVLDPTILVYCGYVGGPNFDYVYGVAADKKGNAYIAGYTSSMNPDFPVKVGPDLSFNRGGTDAFVAKVNAAGTALDYCGFIGGADNDYAYGIAVDDAGNAYVTGYTASTEATFPVFKGPDLTHNGNLDVFVAKVNAAGTALDYCGYIGGAGPDFGRGIAVDAAGNAYVTGNTFSTEATFPVAAGSDLSQNGQSDAFIAKVEADGKGLAYCGFVGGSGQDIGRGIAVDATGNAYITGSTNSTETTFPVVEGPKTTALGDLDAFVTKVGADGTEFVFSGFISGSSEDVGTGIAVDAEGNAYVTGYTASDENSFPVTFGPDVTHNGGFHDAFVAKVYFTGSSLVYCGYIGGGGYDAGTGIVVDERGYAYVTGYTSSPATTFPEAVGPSLTFSGSFDAFVAKVYVTGANLMFCGYVGGAGSDLGQGLALDETGTGNVFLAGSTFSTESGFPALVGPDLSQHGNRDGFVAQINEISLVVTSPNGGEVVHYGFTHEITWQTWGFVGDVKIEYTVDSGKTWWEITGATPNDGSFTWLVPDESSDSCAVRISEAEDGDPTDTSDVLFEMSNAPIIVISSPNGGESWAVGSTQAIAWKTMGTGAEVMIQYTTDDTATWNTITDATANDGTYEWVIPDAVSDQCRVRIINLDDISVFDVSDEAFSIVAASARTAHPPARAKAASASPSKK